MGDFVVHVHAVGNHGCQREKGPGDVIYDCGSAVCVDCITRRYVKALRDSGARVDTATFTHWPSSTPIVENLLDNIRHGSFARATRSPGGLFTERFYPCGCTAAGHGDVPAYCPEHGTPPTIG